MRRGWRVGTGAAAIMLGMLASAEAKGAPPVLPGARAEAVAFADLPGWLTEDYVALLAVFQRSCTSADPLRLGAPRPPAFGAICRRAAAITPVGQEAKRFFETEFRPWRVVPAEGSGFLTGYFEPEFEGALARSATFPTPVYDRPPDLVTKLPGDDWPGLDPALSSARRLEKGLEPFPDRGAIEDGALEGQGLEVAWLRDPVDRFVIQVQGSARLRLPDGSVRRLTYSGRNGHPYTSLGRLLSTERNIPPAEMTMDRLVAHLKSDPAEATRLIRRNRSFVFFRLGAVAAGDLGPIGGEGVPLTPLRSVAADRTIWPYGTPVVLSGVLPVAGGGHEPLARAAVIQDTGSAITGPARIDLFFGSGPEAGYRAGLVRHPLVLYALWPNREDA